LAACIAALGVWAICFRRRYPWLSGTQRGFHGSGNLWVRRLAAGYCWIVIAIAVAVPFGALFVRSLPLSTYVEVWRTARGEFGVTLLVAGLSASALTSLAFLVSVLVRTRRVYAVVQTISFVPFGLAGPLLGLGLIALWNHRGPAGMVYDSLAIVVLAMVARFLVLANATMALGYRRMNRSIEEAARIAGVSLWSTLVFVLLPLQLPYVVACWGLMFVLCAGEVDSTVLVCPPGETTIAVRLFTLMHYGPGSYVAALSLLTAGAVVLISVLAAAGFSWLRTAYCVRD
jgi:iron(III) transport system permease protein